MCNCLVSPLVWTQIIWCCLHAVWTLPFISTGPICSRCACASNVNWAQICWINKNNPKFALGVNRPKSIIAWRPRKQNLDHLYWAWWACSVRSEHSWDTKDQNPVTHSLTVPGRSDAWCTSQKSLPPSTGHCTQRNIKAVMTASFCQIVTMPRGNSALFLQETLQQAKSNHFTQTRIYADIFFLPLCCEETTSCA